MEIGISGLPVFSYGQGYLGVTVNGRNTMEHKYIMEQELGRPLTGDEIVHHIDFNKRNNHPSNLLLTTRSKHSKYHAQAQKFKNCMHLFKGKLKDERYKSNLRMKSPGRPRKGECSGS